MEQPFEKLLGKLFENSVDFILGGGLEVSLNGYVRLTEDVDILLALNEENLNQQTGADTNFVTLRKPTSFG